MDDMTDKEKTPMVDGNKEILNLNTVDINRLISGLTQIRDRKPYKTWNDHYKQCWDDDDSCDIHYVEEILNLDWEDAIRSSAP